MRLIECSDRATLPVSSLASEKTSEIVAELKFSCGHCGQHISCDVSWSGHQIQCPACQQSISVPAAPEAATPQQSSAGSLIPQPPPANKPRLSAGVTQVARATPASAPVQSRPKPRPPKSSNPAIKYAITTVILITLGIVALKFLPGLMNETSETGSSKASSTAAPANSGAGGGPLGEMNGAMDVSDALDAGSSSRPMPAAARSRSQAAGRLATNSTAKATNGTSRSR